MTLRVTREMCKPSFWKFMHEQQGICIIPTSTADQETTTFPALCAVVYAMPTVSERRQLL